MINKTILAGLLLSVFVAPLACQADPVRTPPMLDMKNLCKRPDYPADARSRNEQGTVVFELLIDPTGSVLDSKVISSSGFESLDKVSLLAFSQCHFVPAKVDGQPDPEPAWMRLSWKWKIGGSP